MKKIIAIALVVLMVALTCVSCGESEQYKFGVQSGTTGWSFLSGDAEWGFEGFVTTDACMPGGFMDAALACRNGNELMLDMGLGGCAKSVDKAYKTDPAGILIGLRNCAHNLCYTLLNYTDVVK